jgi:uroporphyrinogen-III synthase
MWARVQQMVTVRQGDRIVVGSPIEGVLARAQTALNAGDLSGAVAELSTLQGVPAQTLSDWLEKARALLAARAALTDLQGRA